MAEAEARQLLVYLDPNSTGCIDLEDMVQITQKAVVDRLPQRYQQSVAALFRNYVVSVQQFLLPNEDFIGLFQEFSPSKEHKKRSPVKRVACDLSKFALNADSPTEGVSSTAEVTPISNSPTIQPVKRSNSVYQNSPTKDIQRSNSRRGSNIPENSYKQRHFERKNTMERVQLESQSIHQSVSRRANERGAKIYDFLRQDSIQSPFIGDEGGFDKFMKARR